MNESKTIANRLKEVIINGTWIANTNYKTELENLDWEIATKKSNSLNTVADLAQHIHYYIGGINNVFINGTLEIKDKYSFDFPPIKSETQWKEFLNRFWADTEKLASYIEEMKDEQLNTVFIDEKYGTFSLNLNALIEHSYYHLGQIVLIKKIK